MTATQLSGLYMLIACGLALYAWLFDRDEFLWAALGFMAGAVAIQL